MSYKKIEEATKALFKSDLEPFKDMVSKEVHCESIHKSSFL